MVKTFTGKTIQERERACRIWQWWKMRVMDSDRFKFFKMALRLVVLTQVSSCSVERVFSRLKMMREACGDNMLEDMVEIRMFCMCNGNLDAITATTN